MTGLNENYRRRILTSLQYADKLLEDGLHALTPGAKPLFSGFVKDLSAEDSRCVEDYARKIRERMARLLEQCHIELSVPAIPSSGKLRTGLNSMDLTLEDIYPEKMRGYGKMEAAAAKDLSWNLNEIRRLIGLLLSFLSEARSPQEGGRNRAEVNPECAGLLELMGRIIADYGLVEFLPAMNAIIRGFHARRFRIGIFGADDSGKSALVNTILDAEVMPRGGTWLAAFPVHIDASTSRQIRISFLDKAEVHPLDRLASFVTEEENPRNTKRVMAVEVCTAAAIASADTAFTIMPGTGYFILGRHDFSGAFLPDVDFGLVLAAGHGNAAAGVANILDALEAAGIRSAVALAGTDSEAALQSARESIHDLMVSSRGRRVDVFRAPTAPAPSAIKEIVQMASDLVTQSETVFTESMGGRIRSLRTALLATLELMVGHTGAGPAKMEQTEEVLRRMDERLSTFQQHWEKEFDRVAGWREDILDKAASYLQASDDTPHESDPVPLVAALHSALAARIRPFLEQYHDIASGLAADLLLLKELKNQSGVFSEQIPKPSGAPAPVVSFLRNLSVRPSGAHARSGHGARARHIRKSLEESIAADLPHMLEEMQPRIRRWLLGAVNALREYVRVQTDPIRYRSLTPSSAGREEGLMRDIEDLRSR